jgi:hypothetical protein
VPDDVQSDMQHRLANPVRQHGKIDVRPDVTAPPAGAQCVQHRLLNRDRRPLRQLDELRIRARCFIEGNLECRAMLYGAMRDRRSKRDDPFGSGSRVRFV